MVVGGLNSLSLGAQKAPLSGKGNSASRPDGGKLSFGQVLNEADRAPSRSGSGNLEANEAPVKETARDFSGRGATKDTDEAGAFPGGGMPAPGPTQGPSPGTALTSSPAVDRMTAQPPAPGDDASVDSLTRRVVWNDFLRKMKDDLGVSADDMLKAFASLSPEDLAKPPAETVDQIVMGLGLNGQQALLAKRYFQDLIQRTDSKTIGDELEKSSQQVSLTLMSQHELERRSLQRSLEQMSQNFFMNGNFTRPLAGKPQVPTSDAGVAAANGNPQPVVAINSADRLSQGLFMGPQSEPRTAGEDQSETELPAPPVVSRGSVETAPGSSLPGKSASASAVHGRPGVPAHVLEKMKTARSDDRPLEALAQSAVTNPDVTPAAHGKIAMNTKNMAAAANPYAVGPTAVPSASISKTSAAAKGLTSAGLGAGALKSLLEKLGSDGKGDDGGEASSSDTMDASYLNLPLGDSASKLNAPAASTREFESQIAQMKPDQPVTVPDLVQHAHVMVRDGGGEMKVTLHPDGLGEVAMKVSVDQGKVNVQMVTESDEAKRLIEHQLNELKSQLTSNHLHVSDIKVDTATNLGKQLEQQYQDAQRQSTHMAWEQFRNDSQGWRRSFFDVPSASVYKGQGNAPRDAQVPASARARPVRGAGERRLDLVA